MGLAAADQEVFGFNGSAGMPGGGLGSAHHGSAWLLTRAHARRHLDPQPVQTVNADVVMASHRTRNSRSAADRAHSIPWVPPPPLDRTRGTVVIDVICGCATTASNRITPHSTPRL
jgi:hypothetical protein